MWKSPKQKSAAEFESALTEMMPAALQVSEKWAAFNSALVFKDAVPLHEQVRLFSVPLADFFRRNYPNISKTDPGVYLATLLIGIYLAKTHATSELIKTADHIENELHVVGITVILTKFIDNTPNRQSGRA